jgi:hypothetical protein
MPKLPGSGNKSEIKRKIEQTKNAFGDIIEVIEQLTS